MDHEERSEMTVCERTNRDVESVGLRVEGVMDRTKWKREVQNYSSDSR